MKQLEFDFSTQFPPVEKQADDICVVSISEIKFHALQFIKFFCTCLCENETCKDCVLDGYRLFVSRIPLNKFYAAPFDSQIPAVRVEGEPLPIQLMSELGNTTERFGIISFLDVRSVSDAVKCGEARAQEDLLE